VIERAGPGYRRGKKYRIINCDSLHSFVRTYTRDINLEVVGAAFCLVKFSCCVTHSSPWCAAAFKRLKKIKAAAVARLTRRLRIVVAVAKTVEHIASSSAGRSKNLDA